jgi:ribonucleotide reductase beta subunit family protein with ferritin-like domain
MSSTNNSTVDTDTTKVAETKKCDEPLLATQHNRFVIFPIKWPKIWDMYKKMLANMWVVEEIHLNQDLKDWEERLNDNERHFIKHVLAFFAASDGIVLENLLRRFTNEIEIPEVVFTYTQQGAIECVHSETYSLLIDTYIKNQSEKDKLLDALHTIPCVGKKAEWAIKWIGDDSTFAERLVAFACVEGIFFSGSFCALYWLRERGLMPGLTYSNELIARDEGMHTDFAALLYTYIVNRLPRERIIALFEEAVAIEKEFVTDALPVSLIGMNASLMSDYIEFVADRLLLQLGYDKHWNAKNPFLFMENISLPGKTNFFEKRVSEYRKPGVGMEDDKATMYNEDEDF